jgi:predicted nucleic acid-binding protein
VNASCLVDSGAILALVNNRDNWHQTCSADFARLPLPLLTSEAVLTELFYFVDARARGAHSATLTRTWSFVRSGAISVAPISDADMPALNTLMVRYRDRPMDFADATLVLLAERESLTAIFTIDHDDFETYRIGANRRFRIIPERQ